MHSAASHFARTIFCWLPPESPAAGCSMAEVRIRSFWKYAEGHRSFGRPADEWAAREAAQDGERGVPARAHGEHEPLALAILWHEAQAGPHRRRW